MALDSRGNGAYWRYSVNGYVWKAETTCEKEGKWRDQKQVKQEKDEDKSWPEDANDNAKRKEYIWQGVRGDGG